MQYYTYVEKEANCFVMMIFFCVNMFVTQISDIYLQYSISNSKSTKYTKKNPPIIMEGKQSIVRDGRVDSYFFAKNGCVM